MLVPVYTRAHLKTGNLKVQRIPILLFCDLAKGCLSFDGTFHCLVRLTSNADRGFGSPAQHHYIGSSPLEAVNTGLFFNYCSGHEMTGFGSTTAETETCVGVNEFEFLV